MYAKSTILFVLGGSIVLASPIPDADSNQIEARNFLFPGTVTVTKVITTTLAPSGITTTSGCPLINLSALPTQGFPPFSFPSWPIPSLGIPSLTPPTGLPSIVLPTGIPPFSVPTGLPSFSFPSISLPTGVPPFSIPTAFPSIHFPSFGLPPGFPTSFPLPTGFPNIPRDETAPAEPIEEYEEEAE